MNEIKKSDVDRVIHHLRTIPTSEVGAKGGGKRLIRMWSGSPAACAKIVSTIVKSGDVPTMHWSRALRAAGVEVNAGALQCMVHGYKPGAFSSKWEALRAAIVADGGMWRERDVTKAATQPVPPAADPMPAVTNAWRMMPGTSDIMVTTSRLLKYGSSEYREFLRSVLPDCGTVRAPSVTT